MTTSDAGSLRRRALRGLLWMDYQRHKEGFLIGLPVVAFTLLAVGVVESQHGLMCVLMGLVMGVACGLGFGRAEWTQGVEEYSLGLPPPRRDRYLVRFALGLSFLVPLYVVCLATGPFGWMDAAWELLPFEWHAARADASLWEGFEGAGFYVLGIGLSLAFFAEFYARSMAIEQCGDTLWMLRVVPFCVGSVLVAVADRALFPDDFGYLTGLAGLVFVVPRTLRGARAFERKDVVLDGAAGSDEARGRAAALAVLIGLGVALALGVWAYLSME